MGIVSAKPIKIKNPENAVIANGTVTTCKYAGEARTGIGPFAKSTHYYKVFIHVDGLAKPLVLKVKEKEGMNLGVVNDMKSLGKMFGGKKSMPVQAGAPIQVMYDKTKPKKCMIYETPTADQPMPQPQQ
ncbi:MAG: hypothetical protein FWE16_02070 [Firmicutes bacterium]|nr:hypothetical protein [Bacillota bacterium]